MPSPFPGMDPYLEHPELWPDVHHRLITAIADWLGPRLRPRYRVAIEKRTYLVEPEGLIFIGRPDMAVLREEPTAYEPAAVAARGAPPAQPIPVVVPMPDVVREGYLEVREVATGEVVTVLEVLSPTNKRPGEGRRLYEAKRLRVLGSLTHLVEIDLLRDGEPMVVLGDVRGPQTSASLRREHPSTGSGRGEPVEPRSVERSAEPSKDGGGADYRILVSRAERRPRAELYVFGVQEPIPAFPLPLRRGDEEPLVDLQALLQGLYDRAGYDLAVDYGEEAVPPLGEEDAVWADALLREKGLR